MGYPDVLTIDQLEHGKLSKVQKEQEESKILYNHIILRYSSILYNLLGITALFILALIVFGRFTALFATLLWSLNFFSISYTYWYFRGDFISFLNLVFLIILILTIRHWRKLKDLIALSVSAIVIGILLVLTRLSALTTLFFSLVAVNCVQFIFRNWNRKILVSTLFVFAGIVGGLLPYLVYNYNRTGEIAPVMNHHAKYWRNHEFADKSGFPTTREIQKNLYCGKDITFSQYVFGLHTIPEVITQYAKGYWKAFTKYLPELTSTYYIIGRKIPFAPIVLLVPFGILIALLRKEKRKEKLLILLFSLIVLFPFAFILPLNTVTPWANQVTEIGVDRRFILPILPYAFIFIAVVVNELRIMICTYVIPKTKWF